MKRFFTLLIAATTCTLHAGNLDIIGVTLLRQIDPSLTGAGIPVAQAEAAINTNLPPPFEVNPAAVGQPTNLFTYISESGTAANFPNSAGTESGHANTVGVNFYNPLGGVAPQVSHVDNYEANYFYNQIINPTIPPPPAINARVVNQSFVFDNLTSLEQTQVEQNYDNYVANFNTIIASGAGNGGQVYPAATAYNVIGVGVSDGSSSFGPTADGRSKPDVVAPGGATSFSTPYVSGAAAILLQAAGRGDAGTNATTASDPRTVKALLLNGAVKPLDWTNGAATPLDARYGAGVLNVFNSWQQLKAGKRSFIESTTVTSGGSHPPGQNPNNEPSQTGWDFNSISTIPTQDKINHYYFTLTGTNAFTVTATLVWNRQANQTGVNDLNLFLYDTATSNQVLASASTVDNVEHLLLPRLVPGRYDLQVLKRGSLTQVSPSETYALAFEFFNLTLNIALTNNNVMLSWPISPAGFELQSTPDLTSPVSWSPVNAPVSMDTNNALNIVSLPLAGANQFFRLQRP